MFSKGHNHPPILTLLKLPCINNETRWKHFDLKKTCRFLESFADKQFLNPSHYSIHYTICGALHDLVPFVHFKERENTHGGVLLLVKLQAKNNTPPWTFFTFFKLCTWY